MLDVAVIGAGQAGLAMAYQLQQAGWRYTVLEANSQVGGSWSAYYDSLTLFSPARYSGLPGLAFPGDPDAYPRRDAVVNYLQNYAQHFGLNVQTGQHVQQVRRRGSVFELKISAGATVAARCVVAASGAFAHPHIPKLPGLDVFGGRVLHSRDYRNPQALAGQRVVVVGSANSAVQIAAELLPHGRISLASRRPVRFLPQRVLGHDIHFWLDITGLDRRRWLNDQSTPVLDHGRYRQLIKTGALQCLPMFERITSNGVVYKDGHIEPVDTLLFATGFRPHLPFFDGLQVMDANGGLLQSGGTASAEPGLFLMGYPRQRNFASATLRGVGPDATQVMRSMRAYLQSAA